MKQYEGCRKTHLSFLKSHRPNLISHLLPLKPHLSSPATKHFAGIWKLLPWILKK